MKNTHVGQYPPAATSALGTTSTQWVQEADRMERTGLWGRPWLLPLLLLWVSGFEAVDEEEKQICLQEGRNLTVSCVYNIMLYESSLKAWQRVGSQGSPETLVRTDTRNLDQNVARVGRYLLEDDPTNAVMRVTVTELQRQDLGLYQCVIDLSSLGPVVLFPRIRLVQCGGPSDTPPSDQTTTQSMTQVPTFPPVITKTQNILHTSPRTVTQFLPVVTASLSSPGLGVNPTQRTDVIRISLSSIVVFVVCGILTKSLVFTVLLVVTQRSFGSRPVNPPE